MDEPPTGEPSTSACVPFPAASSPQSPPFNVWEFRVGGMRCGNCARNIESKVKQTFTSEILAVDVDVRAGRVKVSTSGACCRRPSAARGIVTQAQIAAVIESLGLDVSLVNEAAPTNNSSSSATSADVSASPSSCAAADETAMPVQRGADATYGGQEARSTAQLHYAELQVEGMSCASCARHIEKHVQKLPGVTSITVNLILDSATVEYRASCDPSFPSPTVTVEEIRRQIEDLGYRASVTLDRLRDHPSTASTWPPNQAPPSGAHGDAVAGGDRRDRETQRLGSLSAAATCAPQAATLHLCLLPPLPSRGMLSCPRRPDLQTFSPSPRDASLASSSLLSTHTQPLLHSASTQTETHGVSSFPRQASCARAVSPTQCPSSTSLSSDPSCSSDTSERVAAFVSWLEKQSGVASVTAAPDGGAPERARRRTQVFVSSLRSAACTGQPGAAILSRATCHPAPLASTAPRAPYEMSVERRELQLSLPGIKVTYFPDQVGAREILERAREAGWNVEWDATAKQKFGDLQQAAKVESVLFRQFVSALLPSIIIFAMMMVIPVDAFPKWMNLRLIPGISLRLLFVLLLATAVMYGPGWRFHRAAYEATRHRIADMNVLVSLATNIAFLYSFIAVLFTIYVSVVVPRGDEVASFTADSALSSLNPGPPFLSASSPEPDSPPWVSSPSPAAAVRGAALKASPSVFERVTEEEGMGGARKGPVDSVREVGLSQRDEVKWNVVPPSLPSPLRHFFPFPRYLAAVSDEFRNEATGLRMRPAPASKGQGTDPQSSASLLLTGEEFAELYAFSGREPDLSVGASKLDTPFSSLSPRGLPPRSSVPSSEPTPLSSRNPRSAASVSSEASLSAPSDSPFENAEPMDPPTFFEVSAVLICVLLLGKLLEGKAKRRALVALDELSAAQPEFAMVVRKQLSSFRASRSGSTTHCEKAPRTGEEAAKLQLDLHRREEAATTEETERDQSGALGPHPNQRSSGDGVGRDSVTSEKAASWQDAADRQGGARQCSAQRSAAEYFDEIIPVELLQLGDVVRVPPGATVPADGEKINEEESLLSEALLTGESMPVSKMKGDTVLGGSMVVGGHGAARRSSSPAPGVGPVAERGEDATRAGPEGASLLLVRVQKLGTASVLGQIFQLVKEAQGTKTKTQEFIDRVAGYFVPGVLLISAVTVVVWLVLLFGGIVTPSLSHFDEETLEAFPVASRILFALQFGIGVLSIACPCALGLAAPTALMVGTGVAARLGILVKSGQAFELATKLKALVLDKTGTVTSGVFEVQEVVLLSSSFAHIAALSNVPDWRSVLSPSSLAPRLSSPSPSSSSFSSSSRGGCEDLCVAVDRNADSPSSLFPSASALGLSVRDLSSRALPEGGIASRSGEVSKLSRDSTEDASETTAGVARGHRLASTSPPTEKEEMPLHATEQTSSANASTTSLQNSSVSSFQEMVSAFVWILGVAERNSEHPVAASLMDFVRSWKDLPPLASPSSFKALPGRGISCQIGRDLAVEVTSLTNAESSRAPLRSFDCSSVGAPAASGASDGASPSSTPASQAAPQMGCCSGTQRRDTREEMTWEGEKGKHRGTTAAVGNRRGDIEGEDAGECTNPACTCKPCRCRLGGFNCGCLDSPAVAKMTPDFSALKAWAESQQRLGATVSLVVVNQVCLGAVALRDAVKPESREVVSLLQSRFGLELWMCTGDSIRTALATADEVGLSRSRVVAEALPSTKVAVLEKLRKADEGQTPRPVGMAGDGLNDAPALAHADLSMALGAGADLALTAADVVILKSRISDIVAFLELSRAVLFTIRLSILWACIFNAAGIPLAAGAFYKFKVFVPPTLAGAMMALSSVLVISNALMLRRFRPSLLPRSSSSSSSHCRFLSATSSSLPRPVFSSIHSWFSGSRGRRVYPAGAHPPRDSFLCAAAADSAAGDTNPATLCSGTRTRLGLAADFASLRTQDCMHPLVSREHADA
ncbi:heavy metal translocating P-type ATPase subfamily protein [Toxoplasma gondii CAST]|uniref:Heavy metal translocating P-type ATPase subfamily protein n=1 Tax=Toxoplasma gondii CAST TaxID=943122 RepID=A0A3R7YUP0_TOXGO|nr:heavy metal translocating P-type ATPase subfamily protein [Toxoplasma gondii CAST]